MRFPVPHCAGTSGRHLGGPAGVCRGPRKLPLALPWALPLPLGIAPASACALFMCTCTAPGGPPGPRCSCWYTGTRMHVAMVRSCRCCRAGVIFTPCQQGCAAPWPYYTGTSVSREALNLDKRARGTSARVPCCVGFSHSNLVHLNPPKAHELAALKPTGVFVTQA